MFPRDGKSNIKYNLITGKSLMKLDNMVGQQIMKPLPMTGKSNVKHSCLDLFNVILLMNR